MTLASVAAATKITYDAAVGVSKTAGQAWWSALHALGLLPDAGHGGRLVPVPPPLSPVTTANLQGLANAKLAADQAVAAAKIPYQAAQTALQQALRAVGAQ